MSTGGAWVTERKGWVVQLWASDRQGEFYSSLQLFAASDRQGESSLKWQEGCTGLHWMHSLLVRSHCVRTLVVPVKLPLLPGKVLMFVKESSLWMTGVVGTTLVGLVGTTIVPPPAYTAAPQLLPPADNAGNEHFAALSSNFLPSHWEQASHWEQPSHLASNPLRASSCCSWLESSTDGALCSRFAIFSGTP